jgi:hypothetical protein
MSTETKETKADHETRKESVGAITINGKNWKDEWKVEGFVRGGFRSYDVDKRVDVGQWISFRESQKTEPMDLYIPPFDDEVYETNIRILRNYSGPGQPNWAEPGYKMVVFIEYTKRIADETSCLLRSIDCWDVQDRNEPPSPLANQLQMEKKPALTRRESPRSLGFEDFLLCVVFIVIWGMLVRHISFI